ncbi:MAG: IS66 family transposase [Prevotella sp.]|nr:IS66 family transposase [Prevotella sp.]
MKLNRSDKEFYLNMIEMLQQEKSSLTQSLAAEREEREADRADLRRLVAENRELKETVLEFMARQEAREESERRYREESERGHREEIQRITEAKDREIRSLRLLLETLRQDLDNSVADVRLGRGKRFAPSSERKALRDRDRSDTRAEEKDRFDGGGDGGGEANAGSGDAGTEQTPKRKKKKSAGRRPSVEECRCDEVVHHRLPDYFTLPEGAVYKTRNGVVDTHQWVSYELIRARIVKHVWETASYVDGIGDTHNTLPESERANPVDGCPFSAEMLAFILVEKYGHNTPKNRIRRKLREMGAVFARSTFVKYYRLAAGELRSMLYDTFRDRITRGDYLMVDETSELVGVIDPETGIPEYRKRYVWVFHDPVSRLVMYLYEKGSRARQVVTDFLRDFRGTITTDGYSAYQIYDTDEHPGVLHCGCWAHVRRKFIESLGVAKEISLDFIEKIDGLFLNERVFSGMDSRTRCRRRKRLSRPIVNRIFDMAERIASDTVLMGRELLRKAVTYVVNQKESLRNFLRDGKAEISNNGCEQQMKPLKLDMKNCQNIGSEEAAKDAAFMHSLVQSCRLNDINPYEYLLDLLRRLKDPPDSRERAALLPDRWQPQC